MRRLPFVALAACLGLLPAGAGAADLITMPVGGQQIALRDEAGFDWSGFYAGIYGLGQVSAVGGNQYGIGVSAGVNAQLDFVLVGAEVALQGVTGGNLDTAYGQVLGRVGVLITDDLLLYAAAGYGMDIGQAPGSSDVLLGGGLEVALGESWSVRGQYLHGVPLSGGNPKDQVTLGAHFHF
jgi:outer membrane immunogenic protein